MISYLRGLFENVFFGLVKTSKSERSFPWGNHLKRSSNYRMPMQRWKFLPGGKKITFFRKLWRAGRMESHSPFTRGRRRPTGNRGFIMWWPVPWRIYSAATRVWRDTREESDIQDKHPTCKRCTPIYDFARTWQIHKKMQQFTGKCKSFDLTTKLLPEI